MEQNENMNNPMVENNDKRVGRGLKVAVAVASVATVCGIGFGVYGMIQNSGKDDQISDLKIQLESVKNENKTLENNMATKENEPSDTSVADEYKNFADNLAKNNSAIVFGNYLHKTDSGYVGYIVTARIENSHLTIKDTKSLDSTMREVKEDAVVIAEVDDVISAHFVTLGNGGVPYIYFIKKDGSVARVDISEDAKRTVENLDGYNRIVSISQIRDEYGQGNAQLVDIDGNVYKSY